MESIHGTPVADGWLKERDVVLKNGTFTFKNSEVVRDKFAAAGFKAPTAGSNTVTEGSGGMGAYLELQTYRDEEGYYHQMHLYVINPENVAVAKGKFIVFLNSLDGQLDVEEEEEEEEDPEEGERNEHEEPSENPTGGRRRRKHRKTLKKQGLRKRANSTNKKNRKTNKKTQRTRKQRKH